MRKISLIRLAHSSWTDCSTPHKGVRKRTAAGGLVRKTTSTERVNLLKLQWDVPLATRMPIPSCRDV